MKKRKLVSIAIAFAFCLMAAAAPAVTFAADDSVNVDIPFSLALSDDAAAQEDMIYSFEIEPLDGAPAPSNGTTVMMTGAGEESFGTFTYNDAGKYRYKITQTTEKTTGFELDDSVYVVTVFVNWNDDEDVLSLIYISAEKQGDTKKPASISFYNLFEGDSDQESAAPEEGTGPDTNNTEGQKPEQQTPADAARTGDYVKLGAVIAVLAGALIVMVVLFATRKKKKSA